MATDGRRWSHARRGWPLLPVVLFGAASAVAQGQTAFPDNLLDLPFEDLLQVTIRSAGKREEQIRDIPASVTILTRDEIERYGWVTLEELLRNVPGFYLLDNTEERFIGTRGAAGGGVQFLVNGVAQHPSRQKALSVPEIARLNIPIGSIDRIEIIRGPMSVIYGNNAFLGVVNIVTNDLAASGSRVSATAGSRGTREAFARVARAYPDGDFVLNAGAWRDDGLAGAYADMMSPAQLAALDPAMHRDMDGDMGQQAYSLEFSGRWKALSSDLRWTRRDYGFYALTPAFDDGTRIRLDTLHVTLGWEHPFSDDLGLRATATYSQEGYDVYQADFLFDDLDGSQEQNGRRWELELDLPWRPTPRLDALLGYRLLSIDGVRNAFSFPPVIDGVQRLDGYVTHDLFAEGNWALRDSLRLVVGGRVSLLPGSYRVERQDRLTGETRIQVTRPDGADLNGRIALLWSPTRAQAVKLIWGTASQDSGESAFAEPEKIQSLELNSTWTSKRWALSAER